MANFYYGQSVGIGVSPGSHTTSSSTPISGIEVWGGIGFGFDSSVSFLIEGEDYTVNRDADDNIIGIDISALTSSNYDRIFYGVLGADGVRTWGGGTYTAPPAPVEIIADKVFLRNGASADIRLFWRVSSTLTLNSLSVTAGTLSDFIGSGSVYTVKLTAPSSGAGPIILSITGFSVTKVFLHAPAPTGDILLLNRLTPRHLGRTDGVIYTSEVTDTDLDNINDFNVLIPFDENVTGVTAATIDLSAADTDGNTQAATLQAFEGKNSVYQATIRPPATGGSGQVVITVAEDAAAEGNTEKSLTIRYSDEIYSPAWDFMFQTTETYEDIVSVGPERIQLLRDNQIDFLDFDGEIDSNKQVTLPDSPTIIRAVRYDVGKYIGLSDATDTTAHLFVEGAESWASAGIWKRDTYNASDWAWTRDRRILIAATPPEGPDLGVIPSLEVHQGIRENIDLNDLQIQGISLENGDIAAFTSWGGMASIAHGQGKIFIASNETGADDQNYVFVYDDDNVLLPSQRIPVDGNQTKSLFVSDSWLYRYDDTNQQMLRFNLDSLRLPEPKKQIYPILVLPGDAIDLTKLVNHADSVFV